MRSGRWLVAATLALVGSVAGCAVGDGLRVEGPAASHSTPSRSTGVMSTPRIAGDAGLDVPTVRTVLLRDERVELDIKNVIRTCRPECVRLGQRADIVGTGKPQQVATVSARNGGAFAAFLIGELRSSELRVLWSVEGDDMKVSTAPERKLVVESKVYGPTDPPCCSRSSKLVYYQWNGTRVVSVGEKFIPGSGG